MALEDFSPPADFAAFLLPGVLWVSAPVMCVRLLAVLVPALLVARLAGDFFAMEPVLLFFAEVFVEEELFVVAIAA